MNVLTDDRKCELSDRIQSLLREFSSSDVSEEEIQFRLIVFGKEFWNWGDIRNNGSSLVSRVVPHTT